MKYRSCASLYDTGIQRTLWCEKNSRLAFATVTFRACWGTYLLTREVQAHARFAKRKKKQQVLGKTWWNKESREDDDSPSTRRMHNRPQVRGYRLFYRERAAHARANRTVVVKNLSENKTDFFAIGQIMVKFNVRSLIIRLNFARLVALDNHWYAPCAAPQSCSSWVVVWSDLKNTMSSAIRSSAIVPLLYIEKKIPWNTMVVN